LRKEEKNTPEMEWLKEYNAKCYAAYKAKRDKQKRYVAAQKEWSAALHEQRGNMNKSAKKKKASKLSRKAKTAKYWAGVLKPKKPIKKRSVPKAKPKASKRKKASTWRPDASVASPIECTLANNLIKLGVYMFERCAQVDPELDGIYCLREFKVKTLVGYRYCDFYFPQVMLCVECDGAKWHKDKAKDQKRDDELVAIGISTMRLTGGQIHHAPIRSAKAVIKAVQVRLLAYRDAPGQVPSDQRAGEMK